mmetsp:Transcript_35672/g.33814  ORF Transcript_35672/g.33814 Transcript_35672/m.33814 type:complete len:526 (+) Transcript_35672:122-1699(+)|eukprot:CAMPEP_0119036818 /NCGR_PEP_ID=MMETSP1177-20130426/4776_1 /TAXON_ID=2985 /ORGANISM="Ochromonas sp, Strain CCMP1899" /LENGTH=525 /DNA_ID=CAMNT_0006997205 /DNA_START=100 /DNA_END=1677 /DNA_ORIENTATION=-
MALDKETKLKLAIVLATTFMIVEIFGGYVANSLAIFSDAAHLLTDIAGFGISLLAVIYSKRPGCKDYTYGLARAEVFGALGSILSLWIITAVLVYEAYIRGMLWFEGKGEEVNGKVMFFVAIFGVFVNLCLGLVFSSEHGGAFHPAHSSCSHDHDHSSGNHHDEESPQDHKSSCSGHDHTGHDHKAHSSTDQEHSKKEHKPSGHDHSHGHKGTKKVTEKSSLLNGNKAGYSEIPTQDVEEGHTHAGHSHSDAHAHDTPKSHEGHDHSAKGHGGHDHSSGACNGSHKEESVVPKKNAHSHAGHDHGGQACSGSHKEDTVASSHSDHGHSSSKHQPSYQAETVVPAPHVDFDANIQAAYLHVLTDLIQSIGVAFAGLVIYMRPDWQIIDPICTFGFSIVVLSYTVPLIGRIATVLLEGKPQNIDWHVLEDRLKAVEGVQDVHDLHIWSISSSTTAMTVHIRAYDPQNVLVKAHKVAKDMSINHATIQVQDASSSSTKGGECISEGVCQDGTKTCVVATPSNYMTGGF